MKTDLKKMTFEELVSMVAWNVMESILKGEPLKSAIFQACDIAIRWDREARAKKL